MICEGLADRIQRIRSRGAALCWGEAQDFCEIMDASLSGAVFEQARECGDFRCNAESTGEENFQRFRNELFLQFVARIRPELVDVENPAPRQRDEVARIQREFFRSDSHRQKRIIVELFLRESLEQMAKRDEPGRPASMPPNAENPDVRRILEGYEGKKAAAKLSELGLDVPTEGTLMYKALKKFRETYRARSKKRVKSTA
jgi:hypothetical protein